MVRDLSGGLAGEQYHQWTRQGLTLREMIVAVGRRWPDSGLTGDEVIMELAGAWEALDRHGPA